MKLKYPMDADGNEITSLGYVDILNQAAPAAPDADHSRLYVRADGQLCFKGEDDVEVEVGAGGGVADGDTLATGLTFPNAGLKVLDTNASHAMIISPGSNITADRTLTLTTGDADRTISMAGNLTLAAALTTSGANALTLTTTGATNVTLPTTGTLATESYVTSALSSYQPTTITVADTTDSTCYVALFESATGNLAPKTDGGITYDASTGVLTAGGLSTAGNITLSTDSSTLRLRLQNTDDAANVVFNTLDESDVETSSLTGSGIFTAAGLIGPLTSSSVTITGGTIDGTVIGGSTPAAITGTSGQFTGNVIIDGNLTVSGTTITMDTETIAVEDPLIKLAKNNNAADAVDIGFYGLYDTSGSQDLYAGLFRDATDGKWKLFKDLQSEPTTTVNTGGTGYAVATLVANIEGSVTGNVTGNVSGSAGSVAVGNITGAGTGVLTALAVNVGSAGAFVTFNGAGGTPSSLTLTNATGLPTAGLVDGAVTLAKMADLAQDQFIGRTAASTGVPQTTTITAAARTVLDDTTVDAMVNTLGGASAQGTGGLVRETSPTITTPTISGAISFPDNVRQTFNPGANAAGLNVGSIAGDPDTPSNGDLWYDSSANELTARINGANVALGAGGAGVSDGATLSTGLTFPNTGLHILDTNASHDLIIVPGSNLTADHTLTLTTGDADRVVTINGDVTLPAGTALVSGGSLGTPSGGNVTSCVGGKCVKVYYKALTSEYTTTSTGIPFDNTIPQIGEGASFDSADAYTPASATNYLRIRLYMGMAAGSAAISIVWALFQDSNADALAAVMLTPTGTGYYYTPMLEYWMVAGTTSATTFSFRWGVSSGTGYVNRFPSGSAFGTGLPSSFITIEEFAP